MSRMALSRRRAPALRRSRSVLPGFGLALGFTLVYLALIVLLPLGGADRQGRRRSGLPGFWRVADRAARAGRLQLELRRLARSRR